MTQRDLIKLLAAMAGHVVDQTEMIGTYQRSD